MTSISCKGFRITSYNVCYTKLLRKTYAPAKKLIVVVLNENNIPVWQADVQFQLYNYAELYPLYVTKTGFAGTAGFETGYGSLEVYVSYNGKFTSRTIDPEQKGIVKIIV